ncbi:MAG: galactose oxidase early set domain-containing protein [Pseudonocardia sp.]|nr:galactose oxidase early set domain-containing protein [Pseudonocardia sp.]
MPTLLVAVNFAPAAALVADYRHYALVNDPEYQRQYGRWDVVELPTEARVNAIHAALLPSGKLLIIAGSGNDQERFDEGTFSTLLYDPATGGTALVPTPSDLFCGGHAFLPDGRLLVAGGTQRYEVLAEDVTKAAGGMLVKNENPDVERFLPRGTVFVSPTGLRYVSTADLTLPPAAKVIARNGDTTVTASEGRVWIEAEREGPQYATASQVQYTVEGLSGREATEVYGLTQSTTFDKQEYQGIVDSYEFDPVTERYERVGDLNHPRWYPTLAGLPGGGVIAVSGLDGTGEVIDGQNETYDPATGTWTERPDLRQYFPTYPALFGTEAGDLFYSGSNAGYGPDDRGRDPAFWDLDTNTLTPVPGLRDADQLETSMSSWLGPVQDQRIMVVGGGGVGESERSTGRIDVIDLDAPDPAFTPATDLPQGTRYPNLVLLPDDSTLITGGSVGYRGNGKSEIHEAYTLHPDGSLHDMAGPTVGRNYHSEALLLPDGRVMTLGSDPLFRDAENTVPGRFEHRLEIFTPPYLFQGPRPEITEAPAEALRGATFTVSTPDPSAITAARLMRPGAVSHTTDTEQRSVALDVTARGDGTLDLAVPEQETLVPSGYYMLFLVDAEGTPSTSRWVRVS